MELWREELYHHGIEGQKWGTRNGPPYPLTIGAHTKAERKFLKIYQKKYKLGEKFDESYEKTQKVKKKQALAAKNLSKAAKYRQKLAKQSKKMYRAKTNEKYEKAKEKHDEYLRKAEKYEGKGAKNQKKVLKANESALKSGMKYTKMNKQLVKVLTNEKSELGKEFMKQFDLDVKYSSLIGKELSGKERRELVRDSVYDEVNKSDYDRITNLNRVRN